MPTCPNGHEVDASVAFCHQCGAPLAPPEARTTVHVQAPPVVRQPSPPRPPSNLAVYVLAGIIVVIGLAAIGFSLIQGSDNLGGPTSVVPNTTPPPSSGAPKSSPTPHPSATASQVPAGGTACSGSVGSNGTFGTIGSETSCAFVQSVYQAYVNAGGVSQAQGQSLTVTATSPATHRTYSNIVCTAGSPWVTCVGGNNNTARMFFTHP